MTGVSRHIAEHRLNIREGCLPVRKKKRGQALERNKAIFDEVEKLVDAGIMKEVHYHSWLSNPVMVKKHDDSWRICVDFKDLNKACLKDGYLLPEIDWKVESLCEYPFKCFLDAYKGYHQIKMAKEDEEKTAFITSQGIFLDFIVERPEDDPLDTPMKDNEELPDPWVLFTDGSSCIDGSGAGLIITNPEGMKFTYALRFRFNATNNEAEYEALIAGLRIAEQMRVKNLQANVDSRLVANQVNGIYVAKEPGTIKYLKKELKEKSIDEKEILAVVEEEGYTWMTPIYEYLTEEILPEEKRKARAISRKAANYVLREIHEGSCSMHAGPRSVVAKALRSGYYWPTMHTDARNLIRECSSCQGIDIAGPFPEGPGKVKFLIVAIDYFTKWIEAKPVATITGAQVKKFVWDNIVCRFGLPGEIISDNGKQFRDNPFKDWCEKLCIRQCFASVKYPQANGLVERANRSLGEGIKARLGEKNKNWIEEISHVLWAHRTMIKSSNKETPFSLTYGTKAVIPVKIGMLTMRTAEVDMIKNYEALEINLDLLKEKRDLVYRNNEASCAKDKGKFGPKWEGPYEVTEALGKEVYRLRDYNGNALPRTWNVTALRNAMCMKCKHLSHAR
ncbi:reverse transcriptase domain-containing protein [Tanacetum coccineum]